MQSPAHQLALHLGTFPAIGAFAAATGWAIAVGMEPKSPDEAITLYDTGGAPYFADAYLSTPTIQVRVRTRKYQDGYDKHEDILAILSGIQNQQIGDSYLLGVWLTSDVMAIGRDDNDRFIFTANYRIERQPIEVGST